MHVIFADISPEVVGRVVGAGVVICLLLAGILKCAQISRRPTTHALCVYSLLILLVAWLGGAIVSVLRQWELTSPAVLLALSLLVGFCCVAAWVTALIGLLDIRKQRATYSQGGAQAKWSLGLSTLALIGLSATLYAQLAPLVNKPVAQSKAPPGKAPVAAANDKEVPKDDALPAVAGTSNATEKTGDPKPVDLKPDDNAEPEQTEPPDDLAGLFDDFETSANGPVSADEKKETEKTTSEPRKRFAAYNFEFDRPDAPWIEEDAKSLHASAKVAFSRSDPRIQFLVISDKVGVEHGIDTEMLVELTRNHINSQSSDVVFSPTHAVEFNGMIGVAYETGSTLNGEPVHHAFWVFSKNGFNYQLMAWGPRDAAAKIDAALRKLGNRFYELDPAAIAHAAGIKPAGNFQSAQFGYRINLAGTPWSELVAADKSALQAEFGARNGMAAMIAILPVRLADRPVDLDTLTAAMLAQRSITYPGDDIISDKSHVSGEWEVRDVMAWDTVNETRTRAIYRLLVRKRHAILFCGWLMVDDSATHAMVDDAFRRFDIIPHVLDYNAELPRNTRRLSSLVNNDIGNAFHDKGDFEAAADFYSLASELLPTDDVIRLNYIGALMSSNRTDDALEVISKRLKSFPKDEVLRALQARLFIQMNEPTKARQILADLLRNGHSNDTSLSTYANLVIESGAFDEGIAVLDNVIQRRPTPLARRWKAILHGRNNEHDQALEILRDLHEKNPSDPVAAFDLASVYELKGDHSAAIGISQKLIDSGQADEATLLLHGRNQLMLRWYAQAKETFEKALARYPTSTEAKDFLAHTSNMLGEGDNSQIKSPIAPVEIPPLLSAKLRKAKESPTAAGKEFDAEEVLSVTGLEYHPDKPLKTTDWHEVKIHTTQGVTQFSSLTMSFDPSYEQVFVNRLAVYDDSGKQVATGSVNDYYVLDDSSQGHGHARKNSQHTGARVEAGVHAALCGDDARTGADQGVWVQRVLDDDDDSRARQGRIRPRRRRISRRRLDSIRKN